ncbi:rhodanese-like domain-containing protein [Nocardia sp. NPDC051052]|uniref:rhodanese-like domain-containing protein n=1 Tax=Nocardia sp. NPDC051052 TaxID=3364322 RepID=UPI0037988941
MNTKLGNKLSRGFSALKRVRRIWLLAGGLVVIAVVVVVGVLVANRSAQPAVSVQGGPSGDQLHQFQGGQHAPFISLTDYKPSYDRHDPHYVLVDVREAAARAQSHIPDDIWVPLADAPTTGWQTLQQYRGTVVLVLYCNCPWQEAANESVVLKEHGFTDGDMRVLQEGIGGWQTAGYPVIRDTDPCATHSWPQACSG